MGLTRILALAAACTILAHVSGCATPQPYDYAAFKRSRPKSILVLPPLNSSPDVNATYSVLSQVTYPLAESGYYVIPVTLMDQAFRENGLANPGEIHAVAPAKLREIFGADAALYVDIRRYGTTYAIITSDTAVAVDAKLVDLRTGVVLWSGSAAASSNEGQSNSGGLAGMLIKAVIDQIASSLTERSHAIAGIASQRLLAAGRQNGMLYGPRSPFYGTD